MATITTAVVLDADASVAGLVIEPGGSLSFDPARSLRLESAGNVIVRGTLVSRPSASNIHELVFVGIDETRFVGGGMDPLDSDVGLWVVGSGSLDLAGAPKLAWTRAVVPLSAGVARLMLDHVPTGWMPGDEVVISPTEPATGDVQRANYSTNFDVNTIASVWGRTVVLSEPLAHGHPLVDTGRGVFGAEVANLTRTVRIEGTPGGRAHVFVRSDRPQSVSNVALRHVGPRQDDDKVSGRYAFHLHHAEDGSRGSILDGVVVRQAGSHAFVPHVSHGTTFRDCVAFDVWDHAFWWDPKHLTDDVLWDHCVVGLVRSDERAGSGYYLAKGVRNTIRGCVASGVQSANGGGVVSPSSRSNGRWTIEDCVVHNNRKDGFQAYVNTNKEDQKIVTRLVAYHNNVGIDHGAYLNSFLYDTCTLYGNPGAGIELLAMANSDGLRFYDALVDQAGLGDYGVLNGNHVTTTEYPTVFEICHFRGHNRAAVGLVRPDPKHDLIDLVDCTFDGNELWLASDIARQCLVRVRDTVHGELEVRRRDQEGSLRPEWNARVVSA